MQKPLSMGSKIAFVICLFSPVRVAAQSDPLQTVTAPQIRALSADQAAQAPDLNKLSSDLVDGLRSQTGPTVNGLKSVQPSRGSKDKEVAVEVKGDLTTDSAAAIANAGGTIVGPNHPERGHLTVTLPWTSLPGIAALPEVRKVTRAQTFNLNSIDTKPKAAVDCVIPGHVSPDAEGDIAHAAATARSDFKADGSGVKVGVVSDTVLCLNQAWAGELVKHVTVLNGQGEDLPSNLLVGSNTGEGTALLEIVHRIAPGAQLFFATANYAPDDMADNINALVAEGCRIIVDDATYPNESPFQDGPIAKAVQSASAEGVLFFSSAGNTGNLSHGTSATWEGDFKKGPAIKITTAGGQMSKVITTADQAQGFVHDFIHGQHRNKIMTPGEGEIDLFWDDPLGKATNEYDLFIVNERGSIIYKGNTRTDGQGDPRQFVVASKGATLTNLYVEVFQTPGAADRHIYIDAHGSRLQFATNGSARGHNASGAANAFSVAAVSAKGVRGPFKGGATVRVENYSADGPRRMYYSADGVALTPSDLGASGGSALRKPDLTAADYVTTDLKNFNPFKGTSSAAAHAAGIAALILAYRPSMTPAEIRDVIDSNALSIESGGWNDLAGAGIAMPARALKSLEKQVQH